MKKIVFIFTLFVACSSSDDKSIQPQQSESFYTTNEMQILKLINKHRENIGKKPMKMDAFIYNVAMKHSKNMASAKVKFGHSGFKKRASKIKKHFKNTRSWAENVAAGQTTPEAVVNSWLHSSGHKRNIEGDYNYCGIAIAKNKSGVPYYTHFFVKLAE